MSDLIQNCSSSQLVKAYTSIMMTASELTLSIAMAQVPLPEDTTDLDGIATAIRDWSLVGVKPIENSMYGPSASVEENLEDRLYITQVDNADTPETLVKAFHKAIKWNTPAK